MGSDRRSLASEKIRLDQFRLHVHVSRLMNSSGFQQLKIDHLLESGDKERLSQIK